MKLFRALVTERKKKGDTSPTKTRPVILVATTREDAIEQLQLYWGSAEYKWTRPDKIADFS